MMSDKFNIEILRRNLAAIMSRTGVKPTSLSLKIGNSPTLVKDMLEKTADAKLSTIFKIAEALGVPPNALLSDEIEPMRAGPKLFLKGEVAAGQWIEAMEWARVDWEEMTGRPDVTADLIHRFFLRVKGDSMDQVYPDGTFIECVSVYGRAEIAPGKKVIAVQTRDDLLVEATVKELVERDGSLWLVPRSSNPVHQAFPLDELRPGITETSIVAVVVSSMRPE